jgi:hypothetical protein
MGDGCPFLYCNYTKSLDEKFGAGNTMYKYWAYGLSYGEDKLIGPRIWKDNPQSMKGYFISDW